MPERWRRKTTTLLEEGITEGKNKWISSKRKKKRAKEGGRKKKKNKKKKKKNVKSDLTIIRKRNIYIYIFISYSIRKIKKLTRIERGKGISDRKKKHQSKKRMERRITFFLFQAQLNNRLC